MFEEKFDDYACDGEAITCEKDGFTIVARIERDDDMGPPWKEHDGHGRVSEWRPKDSKRPGEKVISQHGDSCRFYDWQEAIKTARREMWDAPPYGTGTDGERAERAVQRDFENLKAWCDDEWTWCSLILCVSKGGIEIEDYAACLCGVELNHPNSEDGNAHLTQMANELLDTALESAKGARKKMVEVLTS